VVLKEISAECCGNRQSNGFGSPLLQGPKHRDGHPQNRMQKGICRRARNVCDELMDRTLEVAERQVAAAVEAKGLSPESGYEAEEWMGGPVCVIRVLRLLRNTLRAYHRDGKISWPKGAVRTRKNGQVQVRVFPNELLDRILFTGFEADVWMQSGVTPENLHEHVASFYRRPEHAGRLALVLGAGNVASIGILDAVDKLFCRGEVVLLKLNPVNQYLGPFIEEIFGELIGDGYVRVAGGGADVGAYLCNHPAVETIHITGSGDTHDAIVFGTGEAGARQKAQGEPILRKPITSELGNVSPVIVTPGDILQRHPHGDFEREHRNRSGHAERTG
jgi:aldehyde dehydrogenase (NAD(P)+)